METHKRGGLDFAKINTIRRTRESLRETSMVADLAELEAALPTALQAIEGIVRYFTEIESAGRATIPVLMEYMRSPGDILSVLSSPRAETHLVICRLGFGRTPHQNGANIRSFTVQLELIAYRPSKGANMRPPLPENANICTFRLHRDYRGGGSAALIRRLTVTRTGELQLWDDRFGKSEPATVDDVIRILRAWCEDPKAWEEIS